VFTRMDIHPEFSTDSENTLISKYHATCGLSWTIHFTGTREPFAIFKWHEPCYLAPVIASVTTF